MTSMDVDASIREEPTVWARFEYDVIASTPIPTCEQVVVDALRTKLSGVARDPPFSKLSPRQVSVEKS